MALNHSPSIVTNGLVFAYDMGNIKKSFKGAPTTNYVTNALAMTGWNNYSNGTPVVITTSLGTPGYGFYNAGSWNGLYKSVTIPSAGTYTFSAWVRYIGGSVNNNGGTVYISGYGGGDAAVATNRTLPGQWQRLSITLNCTNTTFTFYLISYGGTSGADNSSWEMTMPQAELGSFATSFVDGTRSNTQALVDLTGRSTATVSALTYNSDNTFEFNYANSAHVSVPLSTAFNKTTGTMNFWVYPTRYNGGNGYFVNREDATPNATDWFWIGPYSNTFYFRLGNGSDCCSNDLSFGDVASVIPLNTWTNMCFTWVANGTSAIYKNGNLLTSRTIGNVPATNPASNGRIGLGHDNADNYFHGKMSNVSIYNRALTAAEVKQNFNAIRGRYGV